MISETLPYDFDFLQQLKITSFMEIPDVLNMALEFLIFFLLCSCSSEGSALCH